MKWLSCWFYADIRSFTSVLAVSSASVALDGIATSSLLSYLFMRRVFVSLGKSWLCSPAIQHLNEKAQLKMHNLLSSVAFAPIICLLAAFSLLTAFRVWPSLHFTSACFWMFKSAFSTYSQNTWEKQEIALIYIFFTICYLAYFFN